MRLSQSLNIHASNQGYLALRLMSISPNDILPYVNSPNVKSPTDNSPYDSSPNVNSPNDNSPNVV
jgi:hypothetical protein